MTDILKTARTWAEAYIKSRSPDVTVGPENDPVSDRWYLVPQLDDRAEIRARLLGEAEPG